MATKIDELTTKLAELTATIAAAEKHESYALKDEAWRLYQQLSHEKESELRQRDVASAIEHRDKLEAHWGVWTQSSVRQADAWERIADALEAIAQKTKE